MSLNLAIDLLKTAGHVVSIVPFFAGPLEGMLGAALLVCEVVQVRLSTTSIVMVYLR
jgi:hypothetical protein